jgi:hypothetical protein
MFPNASVQFLVPFKTISITVSNAFADKRSVGEMKFQQHYLKNIYLPKAFKTLCNMFSTS